MIRFLQFNPAFAIALLLVAALGLLWTPRRPQFPFQPDRVTEVTGWVSRTPEIRDKSIYFELSPTEVLHQNQTFTYPDRIAVWVTSSRSNPEKFFTPPLQWGETVRLRTWLKEPSFYAIPGVLDHRWLAWVQGTPHRVQLKSPSQLERLGLNWMGLVTQPFFKYLQSFETHSRNNLGSQAHRLLLGVFLGRKGSLEEAERESIRNLGILHLFVVSGFHVSLIVLLMHALFRVFGRMSFIATLLSIWLYILGIGLPLAAVRAGIIASITYTLLCFGLRKTLLNGLGISALIIALLSPRSVFSASFHLSYVCLCAIGLLALPAMGYITAVENGIADLFKTTILLGNNRELILRRKIRFQLESLLSFTPVKGIGLLKTPFSRLVSYLMMLLLFSFCIQLLLFPVAVHYSNRWSPSQGLNNLFLMPLFSLLIVLCFLFFLTFWTPAGPALAWLLERTSELCHSLILKLDSFSPVLFLSHPRFWEILLYFGMTLLLGLVLPRKGKILVLIVPISLTVFLRQPLMNSSELVITVLDVGQGESIHLQYPTGENALIDTGGLSYPPKGDFVGERLVSRYLWQLRIQDICFLLLTHPDNDHKKGYSFINRAFPIGSLIYAEPHPDYQEPKRQLLSGESFSIGEVRHLVEHPSGEDLETLTGNDASLVLRLQYKSFSMLFSGDIDRKIEGALRASLAPVTALKVAHHGSNSSTSPDFLKKIQPELALVSAGRGNQFGHPSPSLLSRLRSRGSAVFSTNLLGSIRLTTDGYSWRLLSYSIESKRFVEIDGTKRSDQPI